MLKSRCGANDQFGQQIFRSIHRREVEATGALAKDKGCDIGYALADRPREGANSVDACTVTAF
jgi:hypothetical protein